MSAASVRPASELEEDHEAAVRVSLGMRPHIFDYNERPIDPRPCPHWCHYGQDDNDHEINPDRPFDAHHTLGVSPDVALSRYPGEWHPRSQYGDSAYKTASRLMVRLGQDGADAPVIDLRVALADRASNQVPPAIELSVADAADLISALQYVVDLAEGRRQVVKGAE